VKHVPVWRKAAAQHEDVQASAHVYRTV
jgi:hypothetical protein